MLPDNLVFTTDIKTELKDFLGKRNFSKTALLVDENTFEHCYPIVSQYLTDYQLIEIKSGEENKNLKTSEKIWREMTRANLDRNSLLINLGGGVICDMGGFCASTFKRGIVFLNIPTTLLAMVDASIGGKLGIDFDDYKNHIGLFREPEKVLIHTDFLKTLENREINSGFAEIIKHTLIADKGYFKKITESGNRPQNWKDLILNSLKIKYNIVNKDPFEEKDRKKLNFGHTIGHAFESYFLNLPGKKILHGEAVAAGMICETYLSYTRGDLSEEEGKSIINYLSHQFDCLNYNYSDIDRITSLMKQDKKNIENKFMFTQLKSIGKSVINKELTLEDANESLVYYLDLNKNKF